MNRHFISELKEIILEAGKISIDLRKKGLNIESKKDDSPVTNADIEISNFIYRKLTKLDSSIPIICEEQPLKDISDATMMWLVDPIDGTKSYIKEADSFTINIALIQNKVPKIGLIYQPALEKLYFTDHNGLFCAEQNGEKMQVPKRKKNSFIAIVSSSDFDKSTKKYVQENSFTEIIAIPSSIKLCMIAEGLGDIYPKFGTTMEWDIAAGHALVNASGGSVIDSFTNKAMLYGKLNFKNSSFIAFNKKYSNI